MDERNPENRKTTEQHADDILQSDIVFHKKGVIFISGALLTILLLLFANTVHMRCKLIGETRRYVTDVSAYAVSNLSYTLKENSLCIEEMADSFSRMPGFLLTEELLERKASMWNLDGLLVINEKGERTSSADVCELFGQWLEQHPEIYEKTTISYILNHKILFSSPIRKEGEEKGVLIGIKKYDTIQKLLSDTDFQGRGVSFIADHTGTIIFRPENRSEDISSDLFIEKLKQGQEGIFELKDSDNSDMLVSIQPLGINDWRLLTVVPQDILIKTGMTPVFYFIIIILFSTLVFFIILKYIYQSQKKLIQQLKTFSFVDPITNGLNGVALQLEGKRLIGREEPGSYAMVFLNILNFKQINERWGITEGNRALKYIYQTIDETLQPGEYIARSEMDHYFLLLHNRPKKALSDRITGLLDKINSFRNYFYTEDEYFLFDFSVGIYVLEDTEEDFRIFQGKARRAAGFGKEKNVCTFYDNALVKQELYHRHLNEMFDSSLEKEEFEIYLQPKVYLDHRAAPSAEALIRWRNPEEGWIYPSDFIPLFEENGKICRLDFYVFEKVCRLLDERRKRGESMFPVSVNLSRAHLDSGSMEFVETIAALKKKYQIPDGIMEIEMTESIMIKDDQLPMIKKVIDTFHDHGLSCSLDDFGFGFSSLGILKSLNVDVIKLDRKFFMDETEKTWPIVSNFVSLAHKLGMKTVAEGIEEAKQVERLKEAECDMVQGYFYGRPMPVSEFIQWYEANKGNRV